MAFPWLLIIAMGLGTKEVCCQTNETNFGDPPPLPEQGIYLRKVSLYLQYYSYLNLCNELLHVDDRKSIMHKLQILRYTFGPDMITVN